MCVTASLYLPVTRDTTDSSPIMSSWEIEHFSDRDDWFLQNKSWFGETSARNRDFPVDGMHVQCGLGNTVFNGQSSLEFYAEALRDEKVMLTIVIQILYVRFRVPKVVHGSDGRDRLYLGWAYIGSANLSESAW